tara:strand:+ start:115 stop:297 length:183 start_codon:yes stop_codon:yes gene_type:complete
MTEDLEEGKKDLNKDESLEINRGVELLLRNRRKKPQPKTFQVKFSFFGREIILSLDIIKK